MSNTEHNPCPICLSTTCNGWCDHYGDDVTIIER